LIDVHEALVSDFDVHRMSTPVMFGSDKKRLTATGGREVGINSGANAGDNFFESKHGIFLDTFTVA